MPFLNQVMEQKVVTLEAGASLTGRANRLVMLNTSGQVVETTAAAQNPIGFVATDPGAGHAAGDGVSVVLIDGGGVAQAVASEAITRGQPVAVATGTGTNAGRVATPPAANEFGVGIALQAAAAAGDVISILLSKWQE